jgi:hypothetical protein
VKRARWRVGRKTTNHPQAVAAKTELRAHLLDAFPRARVFDAFAGDGEMFRAVWHLADRYVGCDTRFVWDDRRTYVGDNRILMRALDLTPYNIFDLDAFGNVWEQIVLLARVRQLAPGERIGIAYTDGTPRAMALLSHPKALVNLVGPGAKMGLRAWSLEEHERLAILACEEAARRMGGNVERHWVAPRPTGGGPGQFYGAFIVAAPARRE